MTVELVDIPVQACTRLAAVSPNGKTALSDDYFWGWAVDNPKQVAAVNQWIYKNTSLALAATRCRGGDANNDGKVTLHQEFVPRN